MGSGLLVRAVLQYTRLLCIYLLHAVFLSLLLAKVLADQDWNWFYVFSPLFVWDAVAFLYVVLYVVSLAAKYTGNAYEEDEEEWNTACFPKQRLTLLTLLAFFVGMLVKVAAEILFCLYLTDTVPFYIAGILLCVLFTEIGVLMFFHTLRPGIMSLWRYYH